MLLPKIVSQDCRGDSEGLSRLDLAGQNRLGGAIHLICKAPPDFEDIKLLVLWFVWRNWIPARNKFWVRGEVRPSFGESVLLGGLYLRLVVRHSSCLNPNYLVGCGIMTVLTSITFANL